LNNILPKVKKNILNLTNYANQELKPDFYQINSL